MVRAVAQRRRGDRLPRAFGPDPPRADARAPRLRVLLLDRRGEGQSEGDFNARGWGGEPDLRAAIAYLRRRPDVHGARIGGLGLSVGGELLLQTAAHDPRLRAVVSEGAGLRSFAEQQHMPQLMGRGFAGCAGTTGAGVRGMMGADARRRGWGAMMSASAWSWMHDASWTHMSRGDWRRLGHSMMGSGYVVDHHRWSTPAIIAAALGVVLLAALTVARRPGRRPPATTRST